MGKKKNMAKCIVMVLLAACLILSAVPADNIMAEETDVMKETYKGVTFSYKRINKDSVEIIGVTVPKGTTVLKIPEILGKKKVIRVDLSDYDSVSPDQSKAATGIKKLVLPKNLRPVETAAGKTLPMVLSSLEKLESIEIDSQNKYLKTKDGILYDADMKNLLEYPVNKKATEYKMPSSVIGSKTIVNHFVKRIVFSKNKKFSEACATFCENLESIYLPDNVITVHGFNSCPKLKTIRWSQNLELIGAFQSCDSLKKVKLPDTVEEIGGDAFRFCQNLEEMTLPSKLRIIHGDAFGGCSKLKKVSPFPETLAYVGRGAFAKVPAMKKIKKASYLWSSKSSKAAEVVGTSPESLQDRYRYLAVVTVTKGKKTAYYDAQELTGLKPAAKKVTISRGKTKTITIYPEITNSESVEVKKGWKMKMDILSFTSSDSKVAKVTSKGKIKALKKGKTTITAKMKTSSRKCRIKVTVK